MDTRVEENALKQEAENNSKIIHYTDIKWVKSTQTFVVQLQMSEDNLSFFYAFSHFYSILHKLLQVRLSMFACLSRAMHGEAERAETRIGPFHPYWTSVFGEFNTERWEEQGFLRNG